MRSLVLAVLLTLCAGARPAPAALVDLYPESSFELLMVPFFAQSFPTTPMAKGLNEVKVVPAVFNSDKESKGGAGYKVNGAGIGAAYTHAFTSHWGMSLMGAYHTAKGKSTDLQQDCGLGASCTGGTPPAFSATPSVTETSSVLMVTLAFDPFSDPEGFRMPLFVGLASYNEMGKTTADGTMTGTPFHGEVERSVSQVIPMIGAAFQFNHKRLRWTPFISASMGYLNHEVKSTVRDTQTGLVRRLQTTDFPEQRKHDLAGLGIDFLYRPWNLNFVWVPPIKGGVNFLSLKWSRKWTTSN